MWTHYLSGSTVAPGSCGLCGGYRYRRRMGKMFYFMCLGVRHKSCAAIPAADVFSVTHCWWPRSSPAPGHRVQTRHCHLCSLTTYNSHSVAVSLCWGDLAATISGPWLILLSEGSLTRHATSPCFISSHSALVFKSSHHHVCTAHSNTGLLLIVWTKHILLLQVKYGPTNGTSP